MENTDKYNTAAGDISFPEAERLRRKAKAVGILAWSSFALYPISIILLSILEADIGAGGATSAISIGLLIMLGPWILFNIFRGWRKRILRVFASHSGSFKSQVIDAELKSVFKNSAFEDLKYEADAGWPETFVRSLGFFRNFNIYYSNDKIQTRYKNLSIELADANLAEEHEETYSDSDGKRSTRIVRTEVFCGRIIKFGFDAYFPGDLRVIGKTVPGVAYTSFGEAMGMGKTRVVTASLAGWEPIETESVAFGEKFFTFAVDVAAALIFLKPQAIVKILDLEKALAMPIAFYFRGKELLVFLRTGGATFELSVNSEMQEQQRKATEDIKAIHQFLEAMCGIAEGFFASLVTEVPALRAEAMLQNGEPLPENAVVAVAQDADLSQAPDVIMEGSPCNLGGWKTGNVVSFRVPVGKAGRYSISLNYSKKHGDGDPSKLMVWAAGVVISDQLPPTGNGWGNYVSQTVGTLNLPAGEQTLILASAQDPGSRGKYVMNLRSVKIAPV